MSALREIFARFGVKFDSKPLERGEQATNRTTDALRRLGAVVAGGALVAGIRSFVRESIDMGDELDKTSKVIGISVRALQGWRHAASISGVDQEKFNIALVTLQRNMFDFSQGMGRAKVAFEELGISVTDARGELRPVEDVLLDMAGALSEVESSSKVTGILMKILGQSGARLGPLFAEGREGIEALLAQFEELGGGASEDFVQLAAEAQDAYTRLDLSLTSFRSHVGTLLLPVVRRMVDGMTALVGSVREAVEGTHIFEAALVVLGGALAVAGAKALVAFGPTIATFGLAAVAVGVVVLAIDDLITAIEGGDSVMGRFAKSVEDFFDLNRENQGVVGAIAREWEAMIAAVERGIEVVADFLGLGTPDEDVTFTRQRGLRAPGQSASDAFTSLSSQRSREASARAALGRVGRRVGDGGSVVPLREAAPREALTRTVRALQPPSPNRTTTNNISVQVDASNAGDPREVARVVAAEIGRQVRAASEDHGA